MKKIVIKVPTIHLKVRHCGFYKYAKDFFNAAESSFKHNKKDYFSPVPYFLYCKAIELILKSFLLFIGAATTDKLKHKYGHNLIKILNEGEKSLNKKLLNKEEKETIEMANNYYDVKSKGFEYCSPIYFASGYKNLPDLLKLKKITKKLLTGPITKNY